MKRTSRIGSLMCLGCILGGTAMATNTFNVYVDTTSKSYAIPIHYSGISFEVGSLSAGDGGVSGYMFDSTNSQLLTLFESIGIMNIRIGGNSVDTPIGTPPPGYGSDGFTGVDKLFDFASSAGVNVIYSLRLWETNETTETTAQTRDAAIASHIKSRNPSQLDFFCIGNEPNWNSYHWNGNGQGGTGNDPEIWYYKASTADRGYLQEWNDYAAVITNSVSGLSFGGPDTGDEQGKTNTYWNGTWKSWTENFALDKASGTNIAVPITDILQHNYVGGNVGTNTAQNCIDAMLSTGWDTVTNQWIYNHILSGVLATGWGYRMTECDDFLVGESGASDRFAAALWALDYMNWMAAHGCDGVNFHNKLGNPNGLIYLDSNNNYQATPKGLGILAFNLAAPGDWVEAITNISNPQSINATAYAVGDSTNLYVTIINKTHGASNGTNASVTIFPSGFSASHGQYMLLSPGTGGGGATTGTLGGQSITNNSIWNGTWTNLTVTGSGQCSLTVPGCSAAVVHIY